MNTLANDKSRHLDGGVNPYGVLECMTWAGTGVL